MTTTTADTYAGRRSQYMTPALDVFPAHLREQVQAVEAARVAWLKAEDAYGAAVRRCRRRIPTTCKNSPGSPGRVATWTR